ncbi:hypothetical protein LCGC14_0972110 [marine sediment metagenome]|uniref:Uncharacterized protein n=1 Tax=marine sediment metagenome TaxID=412755 RepID=A0A0F9QUL2_9ZZZZ
MTIEEQREAIREGLAEKIWDEERNHETAPEWCELDEEQRESLIDEADTLLAFLTEKGAVLKVEWNVLEYRDGTITYDCAPIAPLMEKK